MRTLRNSINHKTAFYCLVLVFFQITACSTVGESGDNNTPLKSAMRSDVASFYPLAVGNKWIYGCSVEGEHAFDKTLTIVGRQTTNRLTYFRGELVVGDDPNPLVFYFIVDGQGNVYSSLEKSSEAKELMITANPKKGDTVGSLSVAAHEEIDTPAAGTITAIRLENFALDDPNISELKRMDWEGKFYARGVGLVAEADGLGGECILIDFSLNSGD